MARQLLLLLILKISLLGVAHQLDTPYYELGLNPPQLIDHNHFETA